VRITVAPANTCELELDELLVTASRALAFAARDDDRFQRRLGECSRDHGGGLRSATRDRASAVLVPRSSGIGGTSDEEPIAAQRDVGSW
jgi:hypothetical protein